MGWETFFALLLATLQAPDCVNAWLLKYTNADLKSLVEKINKEEFVPNLLGLEKISWQAITNRIYRSKYLPSIKEEQIRHFEDFWSSFAEYFVSELNIREYNSIKHGFRTIYGTTHLKIGDRTFTGGKYGNRFAVAQNLDKHNLMTEQWSHNWSPEETFANTQIISFSITNLRSFLLIRHRLFEEAPYYLIPDELLEAYPNFERPSLATSKIPPQVEPVVDELKSSTEIEKDFEKLYTLSVTKWKNSA